MKPCPSCQQSCADNAYVCQKCGHTFLRAFNTVGVSKSVWIALAITIALVIVAGVLEKMGLRFW